PVENVHQTAELAEVETGRRLVENQHRGAKREDRRHRDLLPLAFGQQERITGFEPDESHGVDDAPYARFDLRATATELARPERDLLFHGCREDLIVGVLEDVAYRCRACPGAERREWSAAPFDPSLPALQDATEQPRERTLSGAV